MWWLNTYSDSLMQSSRKWLPPYVGSSFKLGRLARLNIHTYHFDSCSASGESSRKFLSLRFFFAFQGHGCSARRFVVRDAQPSSAARVWCLLNFINDFANRAMLIWIRLLNCRTNNTPKLLGAQFDSKVCWPLQKKKHFNETAQSAKPL